MEGLPDLEPQSDYVDFVWQPPQNPEQHDIKPEAPSDYDAFFGPPSIKKEEEEEEYDDEEYDDEGAVLNNMAKLSASIRDIVEKPETSFQDIRAAITEAIKVSEGLIYFPLSTRDEDTTLFEAIAGNGALATYYRKHDGTSKPSLLQLAGLDPRDDVQKLPENLQLSLYFDMVTERTLRKLWTETTGRLPEEDAIKAHGAMVRQFKKGNFVNVETDDQFRALMEDLGARLRSLLPMPERDMGTPTSLLSRTLHYMTLRKEYVFRAVQMYWQGDPLSHPRSRTDPENARMGQLAAEMVAAMVQLRQYQLSRLTRGYNRAFSMTEWFAKDKNVEAMKELRMVFQATAYPMLQCLHAFGGNRYQLVPRVMYRTPQFGGPDHQSQTEYFHRNPVQLRMMLNDQLPTGKIYFAQSKLLPSAVPRLLTLQRAGPPISLAQGIQMVPNLMLTGARLDALVRIVAGTLFTFWSMGGQVVDLSDYTLMPRLLDIFMSQGIFGNAIRGIGISSRAVRDINLDIGGNVETGLNTILDALERNQVVTPELRMMANIMLPANATLPSIPASAHATLRSLGNRDNLNAADLALRLLETEGGADLLTSPEFIEYFGQMNISEIHLQVVAATGGSPRPVTWAIGRVFSGAQWLIQTVAGGVAAAIAVPELYLDVSGYIHSLLTSFWTAVFTWGAWAISPLVSVDPVILTAITLTATELSYAVGRNALWAMAVRAAIKLGYKLLEGTVWVARKVTREALQLSTDFKEIAEERGLVSAVFMVVTRVVQGTLQVGVLTIKALWQAGRWVLETGKATVKWMTQVAWTSVERAYSFYTGASTVISNIAEDPMQLVRLYAAPLTKADDVVQRMPMIKFQTVWSPAREFDYLEHINGALGGTARVVRIVHEEFAALLEDKPTVGERDIFRRRAEKDTKLHWKRGLARLQPSAGPQARPLEEEEFLDSIVMLESIQRDLDQVTRSPTLLDSTVPDILRRLHALVSRHVYLNEGRTVDRKLSEPLQELGQWRKDPTNQHWTHVGWQLLDRGIFNIARNYEDPLATLQALIHQSLNSAYDPMYGANPKRPELVAQVPVTGAQESQIREALRSPWLLRQDRLEKTYPGEHLVVMYLLYRYQILEGGKSQKDAATLYHPSRGTFVNRHHGRVLAACGQLLAQLRQVLAEHGIDEETGPKEPWVRQYYYQATDLLLYCRPALGDATRPPFWMDDPNVQWASMYPVVEAVRTNKAELWQTETEQRFDTIKPQPDARVTRASLAYLIRRQITPRVQQLTPNPFFEDTLYPWRDERDYLLRLNAALTKEFSTVHTYFEEALETSDRVGERQFGEEYIEEGHQRLIEERKQALIARGFAQREPPKIDLLS